jgi:nucleotidyltransferase/DNA polymerase involved in DNA repair
VNAASGKAALARLRNVGRATLADFERLGIVTVGQLATRDADTLYVQLCEATGQIHDPCAHDVFTATIHEAKTGEAVNWWACTPARKLRQAAGTFPKVALHNSCTSHPADG